MRRTLPAVFFAAIFAIALTGGAALANDTGGAGNQYKPGDVQKFNTLAKLLKGSTGQSAVSSKNSDNKKAKSYKSSKGSGKKTVKSRNSNHKKSSYSKHHKYSKSVHKKVKNGKKPSRSVKS
jgi:hypothetical protein